MSDTDKKTEEVAAKEFATYLMEHNRGKSHDELSREFQELIRAVSETGKAGTLTYKVTVTPQGNTQGAVTFVDDIAVKAPKFDRKASIFFVDDDNNLQRNDPRQLRFDGVED